MRTLLIEPSLELPVVEPPLGLLYLADALSKARWACDATSLNFDQTYDRLGTLLDGVVYQVVGVSALSMRLREAVAVARFARERCPESIMVMGGPHVTALGAAGLDGVPADFLVYGEGEETLPELLAALASGDRYASGVRGILRRVGVRWEANPPRPVNPTLDVYGYPERRYLDTFGQHLAEPTGGVMPEPCTTLLASRGCEGRCRFCQPMIRNLFGPALRCRSPQSIAQETRYLRDTYGVASVQFADDMVPVNSEWGKELCREMARTGVPWSINARVDSITDQVAQALSGSGMTKILLGVESGSDRVLKSLGKRLGKESNIAAIDACIHAGIRVVASVMIGSPGETEEDLEQTVDMLRETRPHRIIINYTKPTPGSYLYQQFARAHGCQFRPGVGKTADFGPLRATQPDFAAGALDNVGARRIADAPCSTLPSEVLASYDRMMRSLAREPNSVVSG